MDPLTQGVVGTVAAQQLAKPKTIWVISALGLLSGMAPDLDVLIGSSTDPLLGLEYHRHFTHSLLFIPIGALLCATVFFYVFARRAGLGFAETYCYSLLGYSTHGLLDACTSYGTQLFWPFSDVRIAWNTISIIDPLFTLPLLFLVILAAIRRSRRFSIAALCWIVIYSLFGVIQRERAEAFGWQLAEQRGHAPLKVDVKPSFANLLVWKIIYTTDDSFYVDAVRTGIDYTFYPGERIQRLNISRDLPWLDRESQQAKDIERFRWFSNGYIALSRFHTNRIVDISYSLIPNEIRGLWGIELSPDATVTDHVYYIEDHNRDKHTATRLWNMIKGHQ